MGRGMDYPDCRDCQCTMEIGLLLDSRSGSYTLADWYPGKPEWSRSILVPQDSIQVEPEERRGVWAFRCPECNVLALYALDPPSEEQRTLPRAAEDPAGTDALPRPADDES